MTDSQEQRFQSATAQRFDRLEGRFDRRTLHLEGRFDRLEGRFATRVTGSKDASTSSKDASTSSKDLEGRFDRVIDDLGPLKGAHAGNAAGKEAALIARDLGLGYRKSLTIIELLNLTDAADTTDVAVNELRSFHRADLIVEVTDSDGEVCYVAAEASYTVNGRDTERAIRNAGLLTKLTGRRSHAVVAGCRRDDRIRDRVESGAVYWYQLALEAMQAE